ncbi:transposon ty3-g Gag-Pol polyprotein [Plakobranchus ocellatus]|uniref:Transposon ty3-g Gag-Pol polyprotein n=1 Tax=Plakobranchus ocellatus TaxID=259542 RepID=A0AAV4AQH9_9GAST|nr:transposon ty3-g Gag-Pol polyprotein [Plakobranchus ocellatus]
MPSRVSAVKNFPQPRDVKRCQSASRVSWYNKLLPPFHRQPRFNPAPPLPSHKHTQTASSSKLVNEMTQSFFASKQALAEATMLIHPCTDCPIALTCDASDVAIGDVLEQYAHGRWEPLAFFSGQLRKPEIKYSTFDRELLGVHLATRNFRYMLRETVHHLHGSQAVSPRDVKSYGTTISSSAEASVCNFRVFH